MQDAQTIAAIRSACLQNAEELLAAAREQEKPGRTHIAYHLATLALEEVGKSSMIFMSSLHEVPKDEDRKQPIDWIDDHERKLFWAIWSPRFDKQGPVEGIREAMDIAKNIHETRLATLYVDPEDLDARFQIPENQLRNMLQLTEARIEMEKLKKVRELTAAQKSDIEWFFAATENPDLRAMIFSKGSLEKQAEFDRTNDPGKWISWLRETIEESERLSRELTIKELNRVPPKGEEGEKDKWEMTIRLKSWSHSVRPSELKDFNGGVEKIKLLTTNNRRELLIKFIVPTGLPIQMLWQGGMQTAYMLVIAFNIGTNGFWWWYLPEFVSKYAEKVRDLEHKTDVRIERSPQLTLSWGNLALRKTNVNDVGVIFSHLAHLKKPDQQAPYTRYFRALALLAKNDIFLQLEGNALIEFQLVLREAMTSYKDWDGKEENLESAIDNAFLSISSGPGGNEFVEMIKDLMRVAALTGGGKNTTRPVTLDDVAKLKIACDVYVTLQARKDMQEQIKKLKASKGEPGLQVDTPAKAGTA